MIKLPLKSTKIVNLSVFTFICMGSTNPLIAYGLEVTVNVYYNRQWKAFATIEIFKSVFDF